jgi:hypothetical protein
MDNLAETYQHIADILSFEIATTELEKSLTSPEFNWDAIVVEGSKHLVLPALFCRLKAKQLLHVLPSKLHNYLEEITTINRNRNLAILEQTHSLTILLKSHKINHVFLKGTALIVLGCYDDIAERMLGDIDIIIDSNQLDSAFDLLKKNGYFPIKQTLGADFFEHKHLPRLKTKKHICAVELHRKLFVSYKDNSLINTNILENKCKKNDISIPSLQHLLRHNILNYQINDNGSMYNSISFRSAYDTISILRKQNTTINLYNKKVFRNYFNLIGLFFKDLSKWTALKTNFTTYFYLYKLKHIKFYKFWNKLLRLGKFFALLLKRIPYFITNKGYRKALFTDRKRICKFFK